MAKASTGKIKSENGLSLFYRRWPGEEGRPILLFIHGFSEHSGRLRHPVKYFSERGYTIYAYDQRGHGHSGGRRAHTESFARFLGDLDRIIQHIRKKEGDKKLFLIGHSFGGQVALTYGARHGDDGIDGVIVSSPNLRLAMPVPWLKKQVGQLLSHVVPSLAMDAGLVAELVSHDPDEVEAYANDPLINRSITVRMASEMFANQALMPQIAQEFTLPCLFMHAGDDQISDPQATQEFYEDCASADKVLKFYEGYYHELFNEVDNLAVFKDMESWLQQQLQA